MESSKEKKNFTQEDMEKIRQIITDHVNQNHWTIEELDTHIAISKFKECEEVLFDELRNVLKANETWQRCDDASVETFEQQLGSYENEGEVHKFVWFYVSAPGTVFPMHRHEKPGEEEKTIEWYFLFAPEKRVIIKFCNKGEKHALVNDSEGEMYVLALKVIKK